MNTVEQGFLKFILSVFLVSEYSLWLWYLDILSTMFQLFVLNYSQLQQEDLELNW